MLHPILVIQHTTDPDTGWLAEAITQTGHVEHVVQPHRSEGLPPIEQLMAVVVLGGSQSAYEDDRHPYLAEEKQYLKRVDQAGVPILGICLGAQLLADALGGHVYRAPSSEVGYPQLHLTRAGRHDPVLRQLKGPVFVWHHDTFTVPPGADVLAKTDRYPHAYRKGNSLGVQFHPEASPAIVSGWLRRSEPSELESDGINPDHLLDEAIANQTEAHRTSKALFRAWLNEVDKKQTGSKRS